MEFSYKGLWKILIDRDMNKHELQELVNLSPTTIAKMGKGKPISLVVLARIAKALDCDIGDIVSTIEDDFEEGKDA
ncbi:hypothetical protein HMPREF9628_01929 [Peptoanaerobacter stomatis]|uniref:HTH cro/C1-type domain-containing protein n=1 Tax=Peptoanaerobacter stomatis TaxID=796937 RepID=G9XDQ6_9FIRM|nr:helix-turn-helix transcriptional regulator [Peptoanaerobacter stomatis]EHL18932.1 hypothetical protein HMPREF9628_01929 [Peptoanaerobacter stomatis]